MRTVCSVHPGADEVRCCEKCVDKLTDEVRHLRWARDETDREKKRDWPHCTMCVRQFELEKMLLVRKDEQYGPTCDDWICQWCREKAERMGYVRVADPTPKEQ